MTPVTTASTKKEERGPAKEPASSSTAGSRLEIRSWEKLHPHGDVYSPRTGHTVTSKGKRDTREVVGALRDLTGALCRRKSVCFRRHGP